MWIICDVGFFNVICQDGDAERDLLTVKARSRKDLIDLSDYITFRVRDIEESQVTDYRFRVKAPKLDVTDGFNRIMNEIHYPKTKPKLMERHPERGEIYLNVWGDLLRIQRDSEA